MAETPDAVAVAPANETAVSNPVADAVVTDTSKPAEAPSTDDELMKIWAKNNPQRGPDGKFAPRADDTETPAPEGEQPLVEATEKPADQPETAKVETPQASIDPPQSWSADVKAKWASLPPELQTYIAKRESDAHQAITRAGATSKLLEQQVKGFAPIQQLIAEHKDDFARNRVEPATGIKYLLNAQRAFDANPVQAAVQLLLDRGIDIRPHLQSQPGQQPQGQPDPYVAQLEQQVRNLSGEISQIKQTSTALESKVTAKERAEQETVQTELTRVIEDFAKDKPHFEEVKPIMAALLKSDHAKDLNEAYDMAVNAKPDIRARIQEDQRKQDEVKRQAESKAKAEAARKAASVNVTSAPSAANPKSWDDDLNAIAKKHYGAAA